MRTCGCITYANRVECFALNHDLPVPGFGVRTGHEEECECDCHNEDEDDLEDEEYGV